MPRRSIHPLAFAYLQASAKTHHARDHGVPAGMPSPAMTMHRARAAWQEAGCSLEDEDAPPFRLDHEPGPLGDLDLAAEGTIRIERMDDGFVWICVEHEGGTVTINLNAKKGQLRQVVIVESPRPAAKDPS